MIPGKTLLLKHPLAAWFGLLLLVAFLGLLQQAASFSAPTVRKELVALSRGLRPSMLVKAKAVRALIAKKIKVIGSRSGQIPRSSIAVG